MVNTKALTKCIQYLDSISKFNCMPIAIVVVFPDGDAALIQNMDDEPHSTEAVKRALAARLRVQEEEAKAAAEAKAQQDATVIDFRLPQIKPDDDDSGPLVN